METINKQEKLKLMQELGLEQAADSYAEKHNLVTMKFRPITWDKIRELLSVEYLEPLPNRIFTPLAVSALLGGIVGALVCLAMPEPIEHWAHVHNGLWATVLAHPILTMMGVCYSILLPLFLKYGTEHAFVVEKPLHDWEHDLPYGALLAVKEAKEQGYKNFHIAYPTKEGVRMSADPLIYAFKGKKMYNIFAWDDGKVYE